MITCEKYKALIPESTCIARVKKIKESASLRSRGIYGSRSNHMYDGCESCEIGENLYKNRNKKEKKMEFKTCSKCGEKKPADRKNFYAQKSSKDGFHSWCKVCHNESSDKTPKKQKLVRQKVKPAKQPEEIKPIENTPVIKPEPVIQTRIVLYFADHMEAFEALKKDAGVNLRAPGKQALWILIEYLKNVA